MNILPVPISALAVLLVGGAAVAQRGADEVPLTALDLTKAQQEWGEPRADRSVDGHALTIGGATFGAGLGTHANGELLVRVNGATRFRATVGVDGEVGKRGTVAFEVLGDGKPLWRSGVLRGGEAGKPVDVDLSGIAQLALVVSDGGDGIDYDHADWADARFVVRGARPVAIDPPREAAVILTPPAPAAPRIHGPAVLGVRPGHPVLYAVPVTGERPVIYGATDLPEGLAFDPTTGRLSGAVAVPGEYTVQLGARNAHGDDARSLTIVAGDRIALTPPLGWNSWNCFAGAVDDAKVRGAAKAMVDSGLAQHGWCYVNIDDCWQGERDLDGWIRSNARFPDMKALADYVHSLGLRFGIYSSPGPQTCAGFAGSYRHEQQDAQRYAEWGVDYLKHDWCSYGGIAADQSLPELQKPYRVMRAALDAVDRDIVFSLCQYGMGDVWSWGADVGGNCWRTTGDITDTWSSMSGIGFRQDAPAPFAGPGHWNDPDMLVVGEVGWGRLHPTRLTPNEQYTHISLWCLLSAPLLIGCDMTRLDDFTKSLLCNDEVLALDQDPAGRQATRLERDGETEVWGKRLADGSFAAGLFNRGAAEAPVTMHWAAVGLSGPQRVRDLWRQRDVGEARDLYEVRVPRHGVVLLRLWPA